MSDTQSFAALAEAVRDIVDESGGAAIMTREGWIEAIKNKNPGLVNCPERVLAHFTSPLRPRQGLLTGLYDPICLSIVIVFDPRVHFRIEVAREHCQSNGLSDDAIIALAKAGNEYLDALGVA